MPGERPAPGTFAPGSPAAGGLPARPPAYHWGAMNVDWAAGGAIAGLPVGSALRAPVFRLSVPSGDPDRVSCPRCTAPVHSWFVLVCRQCGVVLGPPAVLELATAAVLALLLGRFGGQPDVVAFCFFGVLGVALAAVDIEVQRLPDRLTLPAYPVLITLLAACAALGHDAAPLLRALAGGTILGVFYLALAVARPTGLGGGDLLTELRRRSRQAADVTERCCFPSLGAVSGV